MPFSLFLTGEGHTRFECSNILISGSCSFSCTTFLSQMPEALVLVCPVAKQDILQARKGSKQNGDAAVSQEELLSIEQSQFWALHVTHERSELFL